MKSAQLTVHVVEDDPFYCSMLAHYIGLNPNNNVRKFVSAGEFRQALHEKPDVVTLDYSLPDSQGDELLREILAASSNTKVIMVSGQSDIQVAIDCMKRGAYDYIVKNNETQERLWIALQNLREHFSLREELSSLRQEVEKKYRFSSIIGNSAAIRKVFELIDKASRTNIITSVTGETGTGKELVAKAIHFNSSRKSGPFVAINLAAIPRELVETELFGHEKGAFTGAITRRIGKFEEASKGTLFLDEIAELDLSLQAKLLRVLQEREFSRIGSNEVLTTSARIIVASHKKLADEVTRGHFREDLYYRLLGLPITLPPLRERENDAILIATHVIDHFCTENGMAAKHLSVDAKKMLMLHPFPGNVRQLKSMVELACVLSEGEEIGVEHLDNGSAPPVDIPESQMTLRQYQQKIIQHYLDSNESDILKVSRLLDIGKSTIYRMVSNREVTLGRTRGADRTGTLLPS